MPVIHNYISNDFTYLMEKELFILQQLRYYEKKQREKDKDYKPKDIHTEYRVTETKEFVLNIEIWEQKKNYK